MAVMTGRSGQTIYDALGRDPVHPFPARMAANIALKALANSSRRMRVLDPMMGSGTALAVARSQGHHAIGVDIDPLAVLISKVWTRPVDVDEVRSRAGIVLTRARRYFSQLPQGQAYPRGSDVATRKFIRYWFDEYARRQLAALSKAVSAVRNEAVRDVLWCAFSRLIIVKQAGASLAMDLAHSRPHKSFDRAPAKPFGKFLAAVDHVLKNCISASKRKKGPAGHFAEGDARRLRIAGNSIDMVLTSPPYLNAIDYMRCSRFSLVWMGYSLVKLRKIRSQSIGTEVGCVDGYRSAALKLSLVRKLPQRQRAILNRYVVDMAASIKEVQRVLAPGGVAIYVVGENTVRGVYISNSKIISELAQRVGLKLDKRTVRNLPRNRRYLPPPSSNRAALDRRIRREVILTFKKPRLQRQPT